MPGRARGPLRAVRRQPAPLLRRRTAHRRRRPRGRLLTSVLATRSFRVHRPVGWNETADWLGEGRSPGGIHGSLQSSLRPSPTRLRRAQLGRAAAAALEQCEFADRARLHLGHALRAPRVAGRLHAVAARHGGRGRGAHPQRPPDDRGPDRAAPRPDPHRRGPRDGRRDLERAARSRSSRRATSPRSSRPSAASCASAGRLLDGAIEVLKQAWTGEPFEYRGRTVRVTPRPVQQPRPPILLGGSTRAAARRAARIADYCFPSTPEVFEMYREELAASASPTSARSRRRPGTSSTSPRIPTPPGGASLRTRSTRPTPTAAGSRRGSPGPYASTATPTRSAPPVSTWCSRPRSSSTRVRALGPWRSHPPSPGRRPRSGARLGESAPRRRARHAAALIEGFGGIHSARRIERQSRAASEPRQAIDDDEIVVGARSGGCLGLEDVMTERHPQLCQRRAEFRSEAGWSRRRGRGSAGSAGSGTRASRARRTLVRVTARRRNRLPRGRRSECAGRRHRGRDRSVPCIRLLRFRSRTRDRRRCSECAARGCRRRWSSRAATRRDSRPRASLHRTPFAPSSSPCRSGCTRCAPRPDCSTRARCRAGRRAHRRRCSAG